MGRVCSLKYVPEIPTERKVSRNSTQLGKISPRIVPTNLCLLIVIKFKELGEKPECDFVYFFPIFLPYLHNFKFIVK